jgi:glycosyltransferase involved in cell wall biosynthesis
VGLRTKGIDVVYATSTPLTVGIPAMLLKWIKGVPFLFEVRDQWPKIPIEMGLIRNQVLARLLLWLERVIYRQSAAIVSLSPGMANGVRSVSGSRKEIAVIPNCSDVDVFRSDTDGSAIRNVRGWGEKLVLLHFGAMGKANGLEFIIDAAKRLAGHKDIHFALAGEGGEKALLVHKVKQERLQNVEILPSVAKTELPKLVAACDVSIVIFAGYPVLEHNSANKFFDSLAAGKPVLLNYSGWQARLLEENDAGFGCQLCNLDQFVEKVLYFSSHWERLVEMGQNARRLAEEKFDRDKLAQQALEVVLKFGT